MKIVKLKCSNCDAVLEVDVDNLEACCPYCGQRYLLDSDRAFSEKEKTKREKEKTKRAQMEYEYREKREKEADAETRKLLAGLMLFTVVFFLIFCLVTCLENRSHLENNEIQVGTSSKDFKKQNYEDVVTLLKSAGFENIELIENKDLVTGLLISDGNVKSISINGNTDFDAGDWFPADAMVRITYHTYVKWR